MIFKKPTLDEYRKAVEWYARKKEDNMLHNKGNDHALIIFENLFKHSEEHVRIFAKDLANEEVVNRKEYIEAVKTFIDKPKTRLDILITSFNDEVRKIAGHSDLAVTNSCYVYNRNPASQTLNVLNEVL